MSDTHCTEIGDETVRRILVVANETLASNVVTTLIEQTASRAEVLVIAPALASRLAFWASDDCASRRAAEERLAQCLARLRRGGVDADGRVGDANPVLAAEDALCVFAADEIVVVTHPEGRSNWLAHNVVERVRARAARPVHHVVADTVHGLEYLAVA